MLGEMYSTFKTYIYAKISFFTFSVGLYPFQKQCLPVQEPLAALQIL